MGSLTNKQQAFIDYYLICFNATEAARQAGYSEKTARSIGHENLTKPDIREEIDRRVSELTMSADEALVRMTQIARGDLARYIWDDGTIDIKTLKEDGNGHLLKKYNHTRTLSTRKDGTETESESVGFELYPADVAIERVMKYHGMFGAKGTGDDPIQHTITYISENRNNDD